MIFIDLTIDDEKSPSKREKRNKRNERRLEWLEKLKLRYSSKRFATVSHSSSIGNRVEIADAHSTNNYEYPSVSQPIATDFSPAESIQYQNCVDSTVVVDSRTLESQDSMSLVSLCQRYSLPDEFLDDNNDGTIDCIDVGIAEELGNINRVGQYDNILDTILNGDMSMIDDQAILEETLMTKTGNITGNFNCLIDFHLSNMDSPPSEQSVDPRLTINVANDSSTAVSLVRKKDSLLNGAKGQPNFTEKINTFESNNGDDISDRFGLSADYNCIRSDMLVLPLLEHSNGIIEMTTNVLADVADLDAHSIGDEKIISTTNGTKSLDDETLQTSGISCIRDDLYTNNMENCGLSNLTQSSPLSNVSSTTAFSEYLAMQESNFGHSMNAVINQPQQHILWQKNETIDRSMIQVDQVSSPKICVEKRKSRSWGMDGKDQTTFGRSVIVGGQDTTVKRRNEVNLIVLLVFIWEYFWVLDESVTRVSRFFFDVLI